MCGSGGEKERESKRMSKNGRERQRKKEKGESLKERKDVRRTFLLGRLGGAAPFFTIDASVFIITDVDNFILIKPFGCGNRKKFNDLSKYFFLNFVAQNIEEKKTINK